MQGVPASMECQNEGAHTRYSHASAHSHAASQSALQTAQVVLGESGWEGGGVIGNRKSQVPWAFLLFLSRVIDYQSSEQS